MYTTLPASELLSEPLPCFLEVIGIAAMPLEAVGGAMAKGLDNTFGELHIRRQHNVNVPISLWKCIKLRVELEVHDFFGTERRRKLIPLAFVDQ